LWDDRDERAGVKFNDADLIGAPYQVVIGDKSLAQGVVELKERKSGQVTRHAPEKLTEHLHGLLRAATV
jgi:prolyl-tRNA synthetase